MSGQQTLISEAYNGEADWNDAPCALVVVDANFCILRANACFGFLTGASEREMIGERISRKFTTASRLYLESVLIPLLHIEGRCHEVALTVQGNAEPSPVLVNISLRNHLGPRVYDVALFPASARRSFEEQLVGLRQDSERRASWLAQLEKLSGVGAWTYEVRSGRLLWSDRIYELYGIPHGVQVTLEMALEPLSADVRQGIEAITKDPELCVEPMVQEFDFRHPSGQVRRFKIAGQYSLNHQGEPVIQGVLQDVTEAHNRQLDLWNAAHIDQMTGLGNRYLFNAELGRRADMKQAVEPFSLMVLDLDGFKAVNDTFGHHAGDAVLRTIGQRISKLGSSMAFRLGGDEFAMILERHQGADTADNFARRLLSEICRPIDIGRQDVTVSASIGISAYPIDGKDSDAILRAADFAMYAAKNSGKNSYARYSPKLGERT